MRYDRPVKRVSHLNRSRCCLVRKAQINYPIQTNIQTLFVLFSSAARRAVSGALLMPSCPSVCLCVCLSVCPSTFPTKVRISPKRLDNFFSPSVYSLYGMWSTCQTKLNPNETPQGAPRTPQIDPTGATFQHFAKFLGNLLIIFFLLQ